MLGLDELSLSLGIEALKLGDCDVHVVYGRVLLRFASGFIYDFVHFVLFGFDLLLNFA